MRFASVFFLAALVVVVQSAPVDSATDPLRHDPAAHGKPGPVETKPVQDMPATSMENDSEPEITHDMDHDEKEKPNGNQDKETGKPAMSEDMHHENGHEEHEGHEGHDHASHEAKEEGAEDSHEGHDHGSEGSHESHEGHDHGSEGSGESHEGHDHGSEGSDESHGSHGDSTMVSESEDSPEPSTEVEEGVCISANHLQAFGSHELVFKKHVLARVLCDAAGSCATHGHIVNYKGNSMMMGSYCDIVGCEKKVMEVNSPRYQRGLKIPSVSDDMHFTTFAARFETRGEEAILAAAVRTGF